MELVNRYLHAVKSCLPKAQQSDVVAELADSIQSQVEDKEAELGRPLTAAEEGDILKPYGRPIVAASRYQEHQQLIGPVLYPFYIQALTIALKIAVAVNVLGAIITLIVTRDPLATLGRLWGSLWLTVFVIVGIVTVVVALVERFVPAKDFAQNWDPRSLPPISNTQPVSRATSAFELVFSLAFASWALGFPWMRQLVQTWIVAPGVAAWGRLPMQIGGWWHELIAAGLVISLITAALNVVNLVYPEWSRLRMAVLVVTNALSAGVCALVLSQGTFISMTSSGHAGDAQIISMLNWAIFTTLLLAVLISAATVVVNLVKLVRSGDQEALNGQKMKAQ